MIIGELPGRDSITNPLRKTWCRFADQHEQLMYSYREVTLAIPLVATL
jgi:hypothetical protein